MSNAESGSSWYYTENGRQAGPVTAEALRERAASGRLGPHDLVWREGMGDWRPVHAVPELVASLPVQPPPRSAAPPPLPPQHVPQYDPRYAPGFAPPPPGAVVDYRGRPMPHPGSGVDPAMRWLIPIDRSGWAIAAGYLGLFSFFGGFLGPVAIIVSIIAIRDIRRHPDRHGMGRAVFGLIAGIVGTIMLVFVLIAIAAESGPPSYRRY